MSLVTHDDARNTARNSSFYRAMAILPRAQRDAMFEIYSFCRAVDDIADGEGTKDEKTAALDFGAATSARSTRAATPVWRRASSRRCATSSSSRTIFTRSLTACRWMSTSTDRRARLRKNSIFIATGSPARWGGCRCACSACRNRTGSISRIIWARAATHQHPARHRRGRGARPGLSAARAAVGRRASLTRRRRRSRRALDLDPVCRPLLAQANDHFAKAAAIMALRRAAEIVPDDHVSRLSPIWRRLENQRFRAPREKIGDVEMAVLGAFLRYGLI